MPLYPIKTQLNFTSNGLDQNNPKSRYQCKNELIYIRDFEAVRKILQECVIRFKNSQLCLDVTEAGSGVVI